MRTVGIRHAGTALAVMLAVGAIFAVVAFAANLTFGSVQRVNVAYDGGLANGEGILGLACSADGRYVAFASSASNILEGDTNGRYDIFMRDVLSEETTLVNVTMSGGFGTQGALNYVEMTPDGRYVLFTSFDSDVVPGDTNGYPDVFVRDMVSNETTCVSTAEDGTFGDYYPSGDGSLSDDGRYAVFSSAASNLYPGDANWKQDCIVKDLQSGETTNVSYTYDGGLGNAHSFYPVMSGDGTKVAFISYSTGMVPGDVSSLGNLFFRDLATGEIERVDETTTGGESATEVDLIYCDVDYTGQHVAFGSRQTDIVSVPTGVASQIYLRDTVSDETTVVARTIDGNVADNQNNNPRISADGRWVSFLGQATNLVPNDTNSMGDLFLRDMQSGTMERLNLNETGDQLDRWTYDQALSASATAVAFNTSATNIVEPYASPSYGHIYLRIFRTDDSSAPIVNCDAAEAYVGSAAISITATDGATGSGVDFIEYRLDSEASATVHAEVANLNVGPGHHTLTYLARDLAGNASMPELVAFTVTPPDTQAPTVGSNAVPSYDLAATITVTATDEAGGSGLAALHWKLDDQGERSTASGSAVVTTAVPGTHSLEYWATDLSGNQSAHVRRQFVVRGASSCVLSSVSRTVAYATPVNISGILTSGSGPLAGRSLELESLNGGSSSWMTVTSSNTAAGGAFTFSVKPSSKTQFRVRFSGDASALPSLSGYNTIVPRPSVGTPKAPKTMKKSKYYTVYGYLKPRHTSGTYPVRIYKYRKNSSGKWVSYGYVKARASTYSSYTKYSKKLRLSKAGRWRLRAYAPADSAHASTWSSGYDYVTVK